MFLETWHQYTISADNMNWVLTWHPKGPKYARDKHGDLSDVPIGDKSYYGSIQHLTSALFEKKAKMCGNMKDLRESLVGIVDEMRSINKLESAKEELEERNGNV